MDKALKLGLALLAFANGGGAGAMSLSSANAIQCSVAHAERLPSGLSENSVCATIRQAATAALERVGTPPGAYTVAVVVESGSKIVASAKLSGKALPEQRVAISDRSLNAGAVNMLANSLAAQIAASDQPRSGG